MPFQFVQSIRWLFLLLAVVSGVSAYGQRPQGRFLSDSLQVGTPVLYSLSFRHPADADVFFPDTTYDFSPFQLVGRTYFPTSTTRGQSLDSVVYSLVSFDVEPVQRLSLPVYVWNGRDSTDLWSAPDSILLRQLVVGNPARQALRTDNQLRHLEPQLNYTYALMVLLGLTLGGGLIYGVFGRAIRQQWRLFQMQRRHADFLRTFQRYSRGINPKAGLTNVEKAVVLWKKYLERLERRPITSLTTRELIGAYPEADLSDALREVDATVYGGVFSPQLQNSLQILRDLAIKQYRQRRREAILANRNRQAVVQDV